MREAQIERPVCKWAREVHKIKVLKLSAPNQKGQGDRMFLKDRVVAFIEFKAPGKKPTPLQWKFLNWCKDNGFKATYHDNREEAKAWLTEVFDL